MNRNNIVTLRNLQGEELGVYCIVESKISYTPEWANRFTDDVRAAEDCVNDTFKAEDLSITEFAAQRERNRILEEIEDTLLCWSYPESDVASDVRCVLMILGMSVINANHTEEGAKQAEEWLAKAEDMIDIEYAEMVAHFNNLRKKNRRKKIIISSLVLSTLGGLYLVIRKYLR